MRYLAVDRSEVEFWVYDTADGNALGILVSGKVYSGSLAVGDVLHRAVVASRTYAVSLRVDEISMFGTLVDEIDEGLSAQVLLSGEGAGLLARDALIYRS